MREGKESVVAPAAQVGRPQPEAGVAANRQGWVCPSCYKPGEPEIVQLYGEDRVWRDSTIRRCPNVECHHTFGGALSDRLAHVQRVYGYKYFGDYPLDPEQMDAVGEMYAMARLVPDLLEELVALNRAVDDFWNADPKNREPEIKALCVAQARSLAVIAKARGLEAKAEGRS